MVVSEQISKPKQEHEYYMRDLMEQDAEDIAEIFKIVYDGNYPLKEYEDPDWIRAQVNNPNIIWKVCNDSNGRPVGCGVMLLNIEHRRIYGGRTVLLPELQDKGVMKKVGMDSIVQVMKDTRDKIRLWLGQSRTEPDNIAMQRTLEKMDFRPVALMVDMDTGLGERESEIVQTLIFQETFATRRKNVAIIPEVVPFYEASRKQYLKMGREYTMVANPTISPKRCNLTYSYKIGKYRNTFEVMNTVAGLSATENPYTASLEIDTYTMGHPELLSLFLDELLTFCEAKAINFIEASVSAYEPEEQQVFLDKGFKIAGYFPAYDELDGKAEDRIIMMRFPERLTTKGFEFTKKSWKVAKTMLDHLGLQGELKMSKRGNYQFFIK